MFTASHLHKIVIASPCNGRGNPKKVFLDGRASLAKTTNVACCLKNSAFLKQSSGYFKPILNTLFHLILINVSVFATDWIAVDLENQHDKSQKRFAQKFVRQGQVTYLSDNSVRFLVTEASGPCVILAARNTSTKKGFLAHISWFNEIDPASWMGQDVLVKAQQILQAEEGEIEFYLFGGWNCCFGTWPTTLSAKRFIREISKAVPIARVYFQATTCSIYCPAIMIDMETGDVSIHQPSNNVSYKEPGFFDIMKRSLEVYGSVILWGLKEI